MNVLIVDDIEVILEDLKEEIELVGDFTVFIASNIESAAEFIENNEINYAIIDLKLTNDYGYAGVNVLAKLKSLHPNAGYIFLSGYPLDYIYDELKQLINDNEVLSNTVMQDNLNEHYVHKGGGDIDYIELVFQKLGLSMSV